MLMLPEQGNLGNQTINTFPSGRITLREILLYDNFWEKYKSTHNLRSTEIKEVEKMLHCQDPDKGFLTFQCPECGEIKIIHFSCNSRICTHCGKKYADKWAERVASSVFNVPHRHVVMTIAKELWPYVKERRELQKVLMDCAVNVFKDVFKHQQRGKRIIPAFVAVLHPFGRDLEFRPHIHILIAEGGFCGNRWIPIPYFNYEGLRKCWQYQVLTVFKKELKGDYPEIGRIVDMLFKEKENGFYVRAKDRIYSRKHIARYIGRYIRHPAIAESRIVKFDGERVTFYYEKHDDNGRKIRHYRTMDIEDFITAILQHIPERQFKMVRYYGAYCRVMKRYYRCLTLQSIFQSTLVVFLKEKGILCPRCGCRMVLVEYSTPGPPEFQEIQIGKWGRISDWLSA